MALGRLVLAWVVVGAWFTLATFVTSYIVARLSVYPEQNFLVTVSIPLLKWRLAEAGVLTLIASLWFDSLGSGQWWILFLLIGALTTIPPRATEAPRRVLIAGAIADVGRYVIAGGLLAWRLS